MKPRRDRARERARERQKTDPRPYMMILHEEQVIENYRKINLLRGKPVRKLLLPDEIVFPGE